MALKLKVNKTELEALPEAIRDFTLPMVTTIAYR